MKVRFAASLLTVLVLMTSVAPIYASQLTETGKQQSPETVPTQDGADTGRHFYSKPDSVAAIFSAVAALASACAAIVAYRFSKSSFQQTVKLTTQIADRSVSFEAQTLLLEINKQFIADPSLFAIYDDSVNNSHALEISPKLKAKVEALGHMKLNVFEIVFAKLDPPNEAWTNYFKDSMARCSVLRDELDRYPEIYNKKLRNAYEEWKDWKRKNKDVKPNPVSRPAWIDDMYKPVNKELDGASHSGAAPAAAPSGSGAKK
jgi:hypothetical protein